MPRATPRAALHPRVEQQGPRSHVYQVLQNVDVHHAEQQLVPKKQPHQAEQEQYYAHERRVNPSHPPILLEDARSLVSNSPVRILAKTVARGMCYT